MWERKGEEWGRLGGAPQIPLACLSLFIFPPGQSAGQEKKKGGGGDREKKKNLRLRGGWRERGGLQICYCPAVGKQKEKRIDSDFNLVFFLFSSRLLPNDRLSPKDHNVINSKSSVPYCWSLSHYRPSSRSTDDWSGYVDHRGIWNWSESRPKRVGRVCQTLPWRSLVTWSWVVINTGRIRAGWVTRAWFVRIDCGWILLVEAAILIFRWWYKARGYGLSSV